MISTDPVTELIEAAADAKVSMSAVCRKAGVAASTPSRWVGGRYEPNSRTLRKLNGALAEIISEKQRAAREEQAA